MKKQRLKYPLLLGFSVAFIFLITLSLTVPDISKTPPKNPNTPDFLFEDIVIRQFEKGRLTWEINSKEASIDRSEGKAVLKSMKGVYFDNKVPKLVLHAPSARISLQDAYMDVQQASVDCFFDKQRFRITSDTLVWDNQHGLLAGSGRVAVDSKDTSIRGDRFRANLSSQLIDLFGDPCNAIVYPKGLINPHFDTSPLPNRS
jgi:LPS export ABC transporter protein LptC